jgi:hypothetical protein
LVDPFTGTNRRTDGAAVVGVTVVAGTAAWADALSKVPFVDAAGCASYFRVTSALVLCDDGTTSSYGPLDFGCRVRS